MALKLRKCMYLNAKFGIPDNKKYSTCGHLNFPKHEHNGTDPECSFCSIFNFKCIKGISVRRGLSHHSSAAK